MKLLALGGSGNMGQMAVSTILESQLIDQIVVADADKKQPYGMVMVCVGPKGLPDDVRIVSISELARQSNHPESEVISKIRDNEHLLFGKKAFSRLIDKLAIDVQEGRLVLPIPLEKLADIQVLSFIQLETKHSR